MVNYKIVLTNGKEYTVTTYKINEVTDDYITELLKYNTLLKFNLKDTIEQNGVTYDTVTINSNFISSIEYSAQKDNSIKK